MSRISLLFSLPGWLKPVVNFLMDLVLKLYFGAVYAIAWVLDMLTQLFFIFSGMTPIGVNSTDTVDGIDTGVDILNFFLTQKEFTRAYLYLCLVALGLIIVFTIGKIIKQDYFDRAGPRSKAPIFRNVALSFIALICVVPIFMFLMQAAGGLALLVMGALGYRGGGIGTLLFELSWEDEGTIIREFAMGLEDAQAYSADNFGWYPINTFSEFYWDDATGQFATTVSETGANLPKFYWFIFLFTGMILVIHLATMLVGMVSRLYKLIALFIIAPSPISQIVIDEGQKFKDWKNMVLQEALKVVGCVMSFLIFMLIVGAVPNIDLMKFAFTSEAASSISLIGEGSETVQLSNTISSLYYNGAAEATWIDKAINSLGRAILILAGAGAIRDIDSVISPVLSGSKSSLDVGASGQAIMQSSKAAAGGALAIGNKAAGFAVKGAAKVASATLRAAGDVVGGVIGGIGDAFGIGKGKGDENLLKEKKDPVTTNKDEVKDKDPYLSEDNKDKEVKDTVGETKTPTSGGKGKDGIGRQIAKGTLSVAAGAAKGVTKASFGLAGAGLKVVGSAVKTGGSILGIAGRTFMGMAGMGGVYDAVAGVASSIGHDMAHAGQEIFGVKRDKNGNVVKDAQGKPVYNNFLGKGLSVATGGVKKGYNFVANGGLTDLLLKKGGHALIDMIPTAAPKNPDQKSPNPGEVKEPKKPVINEKEALGASIKNFNEKMENMFDPNGEVKQENIENIVDAANGVAQDAMSANGILSTITGGKKKNKKLTTPKHDKIRELDKKINGIDTQINNKQTEIDNLTKEKEEVEEKLKHTRNRGKTKAEHKSLIEKRNNLNNQIAKSKDEHKKLVETLQPEKENYIKQRNDITQNPELAECNKKIDETINEGISLTNKKKVIEEKMAGATPGGEDYKKLEAEKHAIDTQIMKNDQKRKKLESKRKKVVEENAPTQMEEYLESIQEFKEASEAYSKDKSAANKLVLENAAKKMSEKGAGIQETMVETYNDAKKIKKAYSKTEKHAESLGVQNTKQKYEKLGLGNLFDEALQMTIAQRKVDDTNGTKSELSFEKQLENNLTNLRTQKGIGTDKQIKSGIKQEAKEAKEAEKQAKEAQKKAEEEAEKLAKKQERDELVREKKEAMGFDFQVVQTPPSMKKYEVKSPEQKEKRKVEIEVDEKKTDGEPTNKDEKKEKDPIKIKVSVDPDMGPVPNPGGPTPPPKKTGGPTPPPKKTGGPTPPPKKTGGGSGIPMNKQTANNYYKTGGFGNPKTPLAKNIKNAVPYAHNPNKSSNFYTAINKIYQSIDKDVIERFRRAQHESIDFDNYDDEEVVFANLIEKARQDLLQFNNDPSKVEHLRFAQDAFDQAVKLKVEQNKNKE